MFLKKRTGSAVVDVLVAAAIILFVILPLFSAVIEKYILFNKAQIIEDVVDMTNISVYNALLTTSLGMQSVAMDYQQAEAIFRTYLSRNLKLEDDLTPKESSIAEGTVTVKSLIIDQNAHTVHSMVSIPIRPTLYRQLILDAIGKEYITIEIRVDTEIPVNN